MSEILTVRNMWSLLNLQKFLSKTESSLQVQKKQKKMAIKLKTQVIMKILNYSF